jgi:hypothetical protein
LWKRFQSISFVVSVWARDAGAAWPVFMIYVGVACLA